MFMMLRSLLLFTLSLPGSILVTFTPAHSQIIPDTTLGVENSRVTPNVEINGVVSDRIDGGAIRGSNLFHSFEDFNIQEGRGAYFSNPDGIVNILSRVTGRNPSNIFGTLGVLGNANLFFINPNGIVFGPNARLDLRGSFLASTASSVVLDSFEFSTLNPQAPPLLTVNIPLGLRFRDNPGAIVNQSVSSRVVQDMQMPVGLEVPPTQTLAIVGGDLLLNSGNLTAFNGNILLGSVASPGLVSLIPTPTGLGLDYTGITNFGNIELSGTASVNGSGLGGGAIALRGGNVTLRDRSNLVADTLGSFNGRGITIEAVRLRLQDGAFVGATTLGTGAGGTIAIRATDSVELSGIGFENFQQTYIDAAFNGTLNASNRVSGLFTGTFSGAKSGAISIDTRQLTLGEGSVILSPTLGAGDGGNITIRTDLADVSASGLLTTTFNRGNAGTLSIETGKLRIADEATVSTATLAAGKGGDIIVNASDSVILSEFKEESQFGTNLTTSTIGGTGDGGNIMINTRSLLVEGGATITSASGATAATAIIPSFGKGGNVTINATDSIEVTGTSLAIRPSRSQIVTATLGSADAGVLRINTRRLIVRDGGGVGGSTFGSGKGGDVFIEASESVEVTGITRDGVSPSGIATASGDPLLQSFFPEVNPTGTAGDIDIKVPTGRLIVRDGGTVNVVSFREGNAGAINIVADAIALDNGGSIDGTTGSGAGGNINLQAQDIQLRRGSRISTDARSSNGGNITINSDILVAFPQENSDITANARTAQGGTVTINVPNIFGFAAVSREQIRDRLGLTDTQFSALPFNPALLLPSSDIAAISQQAGPSLQGTVTFSTSGVNPAQGLVELPQTVVDPATLIAANPCTEGASSEFVITGRGGLPATPAEPLGDDGVRVSWSELPTSQQALTTPANRSHTISSSLDGIARSQNQPSATNPQIIPAQGWIINDKGEVTLTAYNPGSAGTGRSPKPTDLCPSR